jgi:hypothetical protein
MQQGRFLAGRVELDRGDVEEGLGAAARSARLVERMMASAR